MKIGASELRASRIRPTQPLHLADSSDHAVLPMVHAVRFSADTTWSNLQAYLSTNCRRTKYNYERWRLGLSMLSLANC